MLISSHCFHCLTVRAGDRGICAVLCPLHISKPERRPHPTAELCRGRKTATHVYLSTQLQFHFEKLWAANSNTLDCLLPGSIQRESCLIKNISPYHHSVSWPAISSSMFTDKLRWKAVQALKNKSSRPLLIHFIHKFIFYIFSHFISHFYFWEFSVYIQYKYISINMSNGVDTFPPTPTVIKKINIKSF